MPTESRSEPADAGVVFQAWLERRSHGRGEPFPALLEQHPHLKEDLEAMQRAEEGLAGWHGSATPPAVPSGRRLGPGRTLGGFRIEREIGRGGMGLVFEAEQLSLHRRVALKILPAQMTLSERALQRFQREAEITGRLQHRGIVDIHQVGEAEGVHFIAMELVEGASLDRVIDRMRSEAPEAVRKKRLADVVSMHGLDEPDPPADRPSSRGDRGSRTRRDSSSASDKNYIESTVRLVCQVADALEHAHRAGVIHRDVKPSNILVRADGTAVLTDFGLAREEGLPGVTVTGDFAGTPNYVSPEQAMSGRVPVDHRSDVFSLGATLYELVTLQLAFPGHDVHAVLSHILTKPPVSPQRLNPALAPDLVTILEKALEKDPDRRYQSARELAEDLRAFIEYRPIRARRTPTIARTWRWVRREPLKAALLAILLFGTPTGIWLGSETIAARRLRLPGRIDQGFLSLGIGELPEAERTFVDALEQDGTQRAAAAGLALALLGQDRPAMALAAIDRFEQANPGTSLARLRVEALRAEGDQEQAQSLAATLEPARTPEEKYVEAMLSLSGQPFVLGLPSESLEPLLVVRSRKSRVGFTEDEDSVSQARRRAREAVRQLEDARAAEPRAAYDFALAWAAWAASDLVVARRYSDSIRARWGDSAVGLFYSALAQEVFDREGAMKAYDRVLELDPGLWMAAQRRAALFLKTGDPASAVREFRRQVERNPGRLALRANLAQALIIDRQYQEAERIARDVLVQDRGLDEVHDLLGCALYWQGRFREAEQSFQAAVVLDSARALYHNHLGWVLAEKLGDLAQGEEHLRTAAELDPSDAVIAYHLGGLRLRRNDQNGALVEFTRGRELAARSEVVSSDLFDAAIAFCLSERGDLEAALDVVDRVTESDPDQDQVFYFVASVLERARRLPESLAAWERWFRGGQGDDEELNRIVARWRELSSSGALELAKLWTERSPEDSRGWNERAWIQCDPEATEPVGDAADALLSARRAVEIAGQSDPRLLDTLACALHRNGEHEEALEVAYRAHEFAPRHSDLEEEIGRHLLLFEESSQGR